MRTAEDQEILKRVLDERKTVAEGVNPQFLKQYERSRTRWRGTGIADGTGAGARRATSRCGRSSTRN